MVKRGYGSQSKEYNGCIRHRIDVDLHTKCRSYGNWHQMPWKATFAELLGAPRKPQRKHQSYRHDTSTYQHTADTSVSFMLSYSATQHVFSIWPKVRYHQRIDITFKNDWKDPNKTDASTITTPYSNRQPFHWSMAHFIKSVLQLKWIYNSTNSIVEFVVRQLLSLRQEPKTEDQFNVTMLSPRLISECYS